MVRIEPYFTQESATCGGIDIYETAESCKSLVVVEPDIEAEQAGHSGRVERATGAHHGRHVCSLTQSHEVYQDVERDEHRGATSKLWLQWQLGYQGCVWDRDYGTLVAERGKV